MPFYSPSTGGFYIAELHGAAMPADVVKVSAKRHADLLEAQAAGASIEMGSKGPIARKVKASKSEHLARARGRLARAAARARLAIASAEQQLEDAATIAEGALQIALDGATSIDLAPALDRRRQVRELAAIVAGLELELGTFPTAQLESCRPEAMLGLARAHVATLDQEA